MSAIESYDGSGADGMPRRAHLYVGNLSPRVTEYMLTEIFAVAGPVQNVKIIPDRNYQHGGLNYGFVEYMDMRSAETALQTLNGRKIFDTEIRVNWAYQGQQSKEDTTGHYHVFVGDLSPEVNDQVLQKAFSAFPSMSDARVMWDPASGKSRGYGFLSFRDKTDAEQAIATMNGEWLGSRAIRVNWANQKTQGAPGGMPMIGRQGGGFGGGAPAPMNFSGGPLSYEAVVQQTSPFNSTVYVGNLVPYCTQADLIPLFQSIGYVSEIRMQADRGFAFVKLDTHENAAMAIVQLQGQAVHGRPIKCSWGKDRASEGGAQPGGPQSPATAMGGYGMAQPMYGMPQNNAYAAYGFTGYGGGFPNTAGTGAEGAEGAGGLGGMPPAAGGMAQHGAMMPGAAGGADTSMAAGGWGTNADQTAAQQAYYQQYYGYYNQAAGAQQGAAGGQAPGMM
ncbi:hypothetical protein FRB96_006104 [Tulasnella sp. 330]|nr:hypothetical protein FRB96_006104 [Tulasnella sp. 330]KAG8889502.1 hypothetical protein FRB98_003976 [Tulasnella sp. 332]